VASLIGLEIVEETSFAIVLQCLLEPSGFLPEKILRRNYAIVAGMAHDVVNSLIGADLQLAKSVVARDDESNRLYFLLVRILRTIIKNPRLSEKLGITPIECLDYRLAASLIEGIGDACVQVAGQTLALKGATFAGVIQRMLIDLQKACSEANEIAFKSFVGKNIESAENVRNLRTKVDEICSSIEHLAKESSVDLMPQILAAVSLFRQIYERSVDMADLVV